MADKKTGNTMRVVIPHTSGINIRPTDDIVTETLKRKGKFGPPRRVEPTDTDRAELRDKGYAGDNLSVFEADLISGDTLTVNTRDRMFKYDATAPTTYEVEQGGHLTVTTPTTTATFHSAMWVSVELVTDGSTKQALNEYGDAA